MRKQRKGRSPRKIEFNVDPTHFLNRDLSWLQFNRRVLNEAVDERTPLIERLRFLIIFSANLDEFVMKRIGRMKRQVDSGLIHKSVDGMGAEKQIVEVREHILEDLETQQKVFKSLIDPLEKEGIFFYSYEDLNDVDKKFCDDYFKSKVFPVLTPLSVDPGHPFPFISNLSFSLALILRNPQTNAIQFSRVKIPQGVSSWLKLPSDGVKAHRFVRVTSIVRFNLPALYPGMEIQQVTPFRVTRNADIEHRDEEAEDLMSQVEEGLKERRLAECVRLETYKDCDAAMLSFLKESLDINDNDVYMVDYPMDYSSFKVIVDLDFPKLKHKTWVPIVPRIFQEESNVFQVIKQGDVLVHHPYESFSASVERFISQAAEDPHVLAIKMTLYRTGDNSPFIRSLIKAAESGKQVVCLIELKARFDEERNIFWANKLEDAGVHVVYGILGLKTHTKTALVVRQEHDGEILCYSHIGTGNYNVQTSSLYTDLGLLTCDKRITEEVMEVFNYLTGSSLRTDYKELMLAPINMKSKFIAKIRAEIEVAKKTGSGIIIAKMNSLEDEVITEALYEASTYGVDITLYVRGFCCLKPGIKGLSERIKVVSVIGRFLEHSRVFYFSNGEKEPLKGEFWIGSADWMHRNLHNRVELIVPIHETRNKEKLWEFLEVLKMDNRRAWDLMADGKYIQRQPGPDQAEVGTHDVLMSKTLAREKNLGGGE
ncbi:MAG: polyphosphate kinase 1 [Bacteriovoracaceae bacterium]|nr:polyphosphate kinase 1 [Bacteriovoracaceae bacterium]